LFLQRQARPETPVQRECGGCIEEQYEHEVKRPQLLQRGLVIGASNDPSEHEADLIAEQVMGTLALPAVASESLRVQKLSEQQTDPSNAAPASVERALASPGKPLELSLRRDMERSFGRDFSQVQVHSNAIAEQSALNVNASAYTVGYRIVFGMSKYSPRTKEGQKLIAHELTHVVQQTGVGGSRRVQRTMQAYIDAMQRKPQPDFARAAERLNGEKVRDIRIVLRNLSANYRVELHKAARVWPGVCSNIARETEIDYLKVDPRAAKAAEVCKEAPARASETNTAAKPSATELFEKHLQEGIALLTQAGFGRAEGLPYQDPFTEEISWGGSHFNSEFWEIRRHAKYRGKLVLKPGKEAAAAIDDMFSHLDMWRFDCGQFVQVANLYALRHSLGTAAFNAIPSSGVPFDIQPQGSSGLQRVAYYERTGPTGLFMRYADKVIETKTVEQLLTEAPIGSRVMWTNLQAPEVSAFRNENAVKLGADRYGAHGFMGRLKTNEFTRAELESALVRTTNPSADAAYIAKNVYVSEIEHYRRPHEGP